ncbi:hypothetical protein PIB30_078507 [Stylosanthes scabra]|uniref:Uncharacterized protein n=1 Tax=Stylosanthes scabra TaxID=79078 RepID=A0ABU6XP75_9FABA|nr:hypothetical protein [Stylosanthes scabra]
MIGFPWNELSSPKSCSWREALIFVHIKFAGQDCGRSRLANLQASAKSRHSQKQWKIAPVEFEQRWQVRLTEGIRACRLAMIGVPMEDVGIGKQFGRHKPPISHPFYSSST